MYGVKMALGSRGITVEAAQKKGRSGELGCICR